MSIVFFTFFKFFCLGVLCLSLPLTPIVYYLRGRLNRTKCCRKMEKCCRFLGGLALVILHSFRLENLWITLIDKEIAPVAQFTYATGATKQNDVKKVGFSPPPEPRVSALCSAWRLLCRRVSTPYGHFRCRLLRPDSHLLLLYGWLLLFHI